MSNYEGAARDYNEALQRGECNVRTYTNFAFCLAKLGYYAEAVRAYDSVLELDPANENALHNRWHLPQVVCNVCRAPHTPHPSLHATLMMPSC